MRGQVKSATAHFQAATLGPDPVRINHASGGGVLYGIFEARMHLLPEVDPFHFIGPGGSKLIENIERSRKHSGAKRRELEFIY